MITLRAKIGQMLIMGFAGSEVNDKSLVAEWLSQDGVGGVLLFDQDVLTGAHGKNLKTPQQIKQLIHQLNYYSAQQADEDNNQLPLFVAIDYEGGAIDRLSMIEGCMATMRAHEMVNLSPEALDAELSDMAKTLKEFGFNLNFAPVVDLHLHDQHGIIGALHRSFSDKPETVTCLARTFVNVFSHYGIASCYKHFPGHGSALGDTHKGFVDVTQTFKEEELIPYYQLVKDTHNPVMIMTAHVINKHLDPDGLPATLSHRMLTGLLREKIGYEGVIVSDDLQMQAITDHYSLDDALCLTINAGADMIIFANQLGKISATEVIEHIESLVLTHKIDLQRIEEAYHRIVRLKQQLNCL
ncbi:MAG: glycoside hydrolase family 3 N-terminal domain-containing protein [Legionella sp.]|uniref:glycoside hydrolase family 3 protein n=1 Tax=Legionella sp. TaxID=459 RepID=UPI0039E500F6